jgi:hypothetical protein
MVSLFFVWSFQSLEFAVHVFFDDMAAYFSGWENSPFQTEVDLPAWGAPLRHF